MEEAGVKYDLILCTIGHLWARYISPYLSSKQKLKYEHQVNIIFMKNSRLINIKGIFRAELYFVSTLICCMQMSSGENAVFHGICDRAVYLGD